MRPNIYRLAGFAFASADLLLEVDRDNRISFALGSTWGADFEVEALVGKAWLDLFDDRDHGLISSVIDGLEVGRRACPMGVRGSAMTGWTTAGLSAIRMPERPDRVSCAVSFRTLTPIVSSHAASADGLYERSELESAADPILRLAQATGLELDLAVIEIGGVGAALAGLGADAAGDLRRRVAGAVRAESFSGAAGVRLADDRFAILRQRGEDSARLCARLARVIGMAAGGASLTPTARLAPAPDGPDALKLLCSAVDAFVREGGGDLRRKVEETLGQASILRSIIDQRRFHLVFQPVVRLADGTTHHHEALVRFDGDESPFAMIRLAEQLDLIESLDLAILDAALARLQASPDLSLAVNVSGLSIGQDSFAAAALARIPAGLKGRLMFEVTESGGIEDLGAASARLECFRKLGVKVFLDDFGAGAASLDYLRQLPVDAVKIDGRYILESRTSERSRALVRHISGLCHELGIETVAEMIESREVETIVIAAGVSYGQGWLYGRPDVLKRTPRKPMTLLGAALSPAAVAARRQGEMQSWR